MPRVARTILVGDVHGCPDELDRLLDELHYRQGFDRLVLVGDLVARGPDSGRAVARAMAHGARAVRGNHDEKVLTWWRVASVSGEDAADRKVKLSERHRFAVTQMRPEHFAFLEGLPLMLPLPEHGVTVVHAGVDPSAPLDAQDPALLMNIRSIGADGRATRHLEDTPWATRWRGPTHLVFGHDARRGVQLEAFATGLDSGCCYGRELTALVLFAGQRVPRDVRERKGCLHAVPAARAYCPMGDGTGPE